MIIFDRNSFGYVLQGEVLSASLQGNGLDLGLEIVNTYCEIVFNTTIISRRIVHK